MTDREALVAAVKSTRNLNEAANRLDVSRRTLQNRMREYNLPRGHGGRPRADLAGAGGMSISDVAAGVLLIGGGFFLGRWLARAGGSKQVITGAAVLGAL